MDVNHFLIDVHHFRKLPAIGCQKPPRHLKQGRIEIAWPRQKKRGLWGGEARLGWEDAKLRPSPQAMVLQDIFDAQ